MRIKVYKSIVVLMFVLLCVSNISVYGASNNATYQSFKFGDSVIGILDTNGILTISGSGPMYDFAESESDVTAEMPLSPMYKNSNVKKVVIQNGVTYLGKNTFYDCMNNKEVVIEGSVKEISFDAFIWNHCLQKVTLNAGIEKIGIGAFSRCPKLKEVNLPSTLKSIESYAFYGAFDLEQINLPEGLQEIGCYAFGGCILLKEINIPSTVTEIQMSILGACSNLMEGKEYLLTNINVSSLNSKYTSIDGVLYSKDKKKIIWYPEGRKQSLYEVMDGTEVIGSNAMSNQYIKTIKVPESVTVFEEGAFAGAYNLENVNIPSNLSSIGSYAFEACWKIKRLEIPDTVTSIGYWAFAKCLSLENIYIYNDQVTIRRCRINGERFRILFFIIAMKQ